MKNEKQQPLEAIGEIGKNACNLTLLAGFSAAVGFIAGLFIAPKAGKDLRKEIEEKSHQFVDKAKEKISQLTPKVNSQLNNYRNQMSSVASN